MLKIQAFHNYLAHLSKREKFVLYGAMLFVSLAVSDRLIVHPISYKIKSLNEEIREKEAGIKKDLRIISQKDRISAESAKYASYLIKSKSEEEEISSLLKEIENLANMTSVYLVNLKPKEPIDMGAYRKYLVNLNCEAQMEQISAFMYNIESSNKLLTVEKYQIGPKAKGSSVARCSMLISKMTMP